MFRGGPCRSQACYVWVKGDRKLPEGVEWLGVGKGPVGFMFQSVVRGVTAHPITAAATGAMTNSDRANHQSTRV